MFITSKTKARYICGGMNFLFFLNHQKTNIYKPATTIKASQNRKLYFANFHEML